MLRYAVLMKPPPEIRLTPHHIVRMIDCVVRKYVSGTATMRSSMYGSWEGEPRAKQLLQQFSASPDTTVRVVLPTRRDHICAGSSAQDTKCLGFTNPKMTGCLSTGKLWKELRIAWQMGIRIGGTYTFRKLAEKRHNTPFGT